MELLATIPSVNELNQAEKAIMRSVLYFDVFDHPLTRSEVIENCGRKITPAEAANALNFLVEKGLLTEFAGFVYSSLSSSAIIEKRIFCNKNAAAVMKKALRYSRLISRFPFVEGLCISGSLSKGVLDHEGDVDYFIITRPSRLWLCRSLLVMWKKIFLLNSRKYFCVNYFVDTNHLLIPDRNTFVATEVKYLLPVYNYQLYERFMEVNKWTSDFLPNRKNNDGSYCGPVKKGWLKKSLEKIFAGSAGEKLDNFFFKLTLKRWKKKFSHFSEEDFDLNMRTRKNVSKHHPRGYQHKVLSALEEKTRQSEERYSFKINH